MKRYDIICSGFMSLETNNGEWVRYRDIKPLLDSMSLKGEIRKLRQEMKSLQQVIRAGGGARHISRTF